MDMNYFMGQGIVTVAPRDPLTGAIGGYVEMGDVDAFQINPEQKFDDVEESMSGLRLTAAHIPISTSFRFKCKCLYYSAHNLALACADANIPGANANGTNVIQAATGPSQEFAFHFEGINTADNGNPIVVDVWRVALDMAKVIDFIMAKHSELELDGMVLPDMARNGTTESRYFTITKTA